MTAYVINAALENERNDIAASSSRSPTTGHGARPARRIAATPYGTRKSPRRTIAPSPMLSDGRSSLSARWPVRTPVAPRKINLHSSPATRNADEKPPSVDALSSDTTDVDALPR